MPAGRGHPIHYNNGVGVIVSHTGRLRSHLQPRAAHRQRQGRVAVWGQRSTPRLCRVPTPTGSVRTARGRRGRWPLSLLSSSEPPSSLHFYVRPLITDNSIQTTAYHVDAAINKGGVPQPDVCPPAESATGIDICTDTVIMVNRKRVAVQHIVLIRIHAGVITRNTEYGQPHVSAKAAAEGFVNDIVVGHESQFCRSAFLVVM